MIEVDYINYIYNGKLVRIYPKSSIKLTKIKPTSKTSHLPGELKLKQVKFKPFSLYKINKMNTPKCKCSVCNLFTTQWVGDKCMHCFKEEVQIPLKNDLRRYQDALFDTEKHFWKTVDQLNSRWEVKTVNFICNKANQLSHYFWSAIGFIRLFTVSGVAGFKNLIPSFKK